MRVVGYDIDPAMLSVARKRGGHGIKYVRGDARKLAFKNATFGGVTAFTALHWFLEKNSLREIKRVLKPNTPLCVVQPEHTAPFRNDLNRIIQKEFPKKRVAQYSTERFVTALRRAGFRRVNEKVIDVNFTYSLPQYLILIQTYSVWNRVPTNARRTMLAILKKHFATKLVRGRIHDTQEITVTVGYT
jgi:ubiquinone/menaquinone biosynthesis C-methylase UbiE